MWQQSYLTKKAPSLLQMSTDVSDMKSKVTTMQGLLTAIFQKLTNVGAGCAQPTPTMNTQMNEMGSNVVHEASPTTSPNFSCLFDSVNASASTPMVHQWLKGFSWPMQHLKFVMGGVCSLVKKSVCR